MESSQGTDRATDDSKVAAAEISTDHLDTGVEVASYTGEREAELARAFLAKIDASHIATTQYVDAYLAAMVFSHSGTAAAMVGTSGAEIQM